MPWDCSLNHHVHAKVDYYSTLLTGSRRITPSMTDDAASEFLSSITALQSTALKAAASVANYALPTKLDVLKDP